MKNIVNLWLDDERPCPYVGNWLVAKNYEQAVQILRTHVVNRSSLDHDLSWEHYVPGAYHLPEVYNNFTEKTGYDLVKWMHENDCWPLQAPVVHSQNPVGARRMAEIIADHYGCYVSGLLQPYRKPR